MGVIVSPPPASLRLPDSGAMIDMTEWTSAVVVVRVSLLTPGLDVALAELVREPVIPPPQWGYES